MVSATGHCAGSLEPAETKAQASIYVLVICRDKGAEQIQIPSSGDNNTIDP